MIGGWSAYVVPAPAAATRPGAGWPAGVREHAACRLPEYMVPSSVMVLETAAADGEREGGPRGAACPGLRRGRGPGRGPATVREELLCAVFAQVLGLTGSGLRMISSRWAGIRCWRCGWCRVRAVLGAELDVRAVFEAPTPAAAGGAAGPGGPGAAAAGGAGTARAGAVVVCPAAAVVHRPAGGPVGGLQQPGGGAAGRGAGCRRRWRRRWPM